MGRNWSFGGYNSMLPKTDGKIHVTDGKMQNFMRIPKSLELGLEN